MERSFGENCRRNSLEARTVLELGAVTERNNCFGGFLWIGFDDRRFCDWPEGELSIGFIFSIGGPL